MANGKTKKPVRREKRAIKKTVRKINRITKLVKKGQYKKAENRATRYDIQRKRKK